MTQKAFPKNIFIVGGGTAGWLTALFAKKKLPNANVVVVESEDIGILGAGEGTTPHFVDFVELLDIPVSRLVAETDATIKHGIKFSGWGRKDSYYHGFQSSHDVSLSFLDSPTTLYYTNTLSIYATAMGKSLNESNFPMKVGEKGKVCFYPKKSYSYSKGAPPTEMYNMKSNFALHINARKLADLLKNIALDERGISRVEGRVVGSKVSGDGYIYALNMLDGSEHLCDFVFDCTGFARVFSQGVYESPWISYEEYLTVNSAQTFFLPPEEVIPSYTESIAMDFGWAWKIPLQERYGCGYVYDSRHTSQEEVQGEVLKKFGGEVSFGKNISFTPGCLEKQWNKNCIAIGLSSGFIEPLEATAIWTSIVALKKAFFDLRSFALMDDSYIEDFNTEMVEANEEILSFVYYHYVCKKDLNTFWSNYKIDNGPPQLKAIAESSKGRLLSYKDFSGLFPLESWISVSEGVGGLDREFLTEVYNYNLLRYDLETPYLAGVGKQDRLVEKCVDHRKFLSSLI